MNDDTLTEFAKWRARVAGRCAVRSGSTVEVEYLRALCMSIGDLLLVATHMPLGACMLEMLTTFDNLPEAEKQPRQDDPVHSNALTAWVDEQVKAARAEPETNGPSVVYKVTRPEVFAEARKRFPSEDVAGAIFAAALDIGRRMELEAYAAAPSLADVVRGLGAVQQAYWDEFAEDLAELDRRGIILDSDPRKKPPEPTP